MSTLDALAPAVPDKLSVHRRYLFVGLTLLIVCGAIIRSAVATRIDGLTLDEAYHIAAGVSYVRALDFWINPEHPPLVKLWVGSFISATGFHLSKLRPFADKYDERVFAEQDVYLHSDFNSVQRRARIAMWMPNGLLLVLFAFAVRRAFGFDAAIGALLFPCNRSDRRGAPACGNDGPFGLAAVGHFRCSFRTSLLWVGLG